MLRHSAIRILSLRASTPRTLPLQPFRTRNYSTPAPQINVSSLSMERYHSLSDKTMNSLLEELEDIVDQHGNPSHEVDYHSGVLTLRLGEAGTYVINKQPPNKQIWLSSPFSGPKRFDYSEADDSWRYARDGQSMSSLLDEELGRVLEEPVKLLAKPAS